MTRRNSFFLPRNFLWLILIIFVRAQRNIELLLLAIIKVCFYFIIILMPNTTTKKSSWWWIIIMIPLWCHMNGCSFQLTLYLKYAGWLWNVFFFNFFTAMENVLYRSLYAYYVICILALYPCVFLLLFLSRTLKAIFICAHKLIEDVHRHKHHPNRYWKLI